MEKDDKSLFSPEFSKSVSLLHVDLDFVIYDSRFRDTVAVFVGPWETKFSVHKDFLCEVSVYFRAALTGDFEEAEKEEIFLAEQDDDVFEIFVDWLYTKTMKTDSVTIKKGKCVEWETAVKIYVFGQYIQCARLCNDLLDTIWGILLQYRNYTVPDDYIIRLIYAETPQECGFRKLIASLFVWSEDKNVWRNVNERRAWLNTLPVDFCHDLLIYSRRKEIGFDPSPFHIARADVNPFKDEEERK